jgi:hypothetical protein
VNISRDDDAQRVLEQRALANVQSLAEHLESQDKLDRRAEKWGARLVIVAVGGILLALGILFVLRAPPANEEEFKRCVFDTQAKASFGYRERMRAENPGMSERALDARAYDQYESLEPFARRECTTKFGRK